MKKYVIVFLISLFCFYFLLAGLFGANGYFYNQNLRKQINEKEIKAEKLKQDIINLKNQREKLATEDGLRDTAMSLGYYVEGDTVYLFDTVALQEDLISSDLVPIKTFSYKALSSIAIILISIGISSVISFVIWVLSKDDINRDDSDNEEEQLIIPDHSSDYYINA